MGINSLQRERDQLRIIDNIQAKHSSGDINPYCTNFNVAVSLFDINANEKAQKYFQLAYESVNYSDVYHNKYASYCGLVRFLNGDMAGLLLCQEAAKHEYQDADVYLNLARAELKLKRRKNAINALDQGSKIDAEHVGIKKMRELLGVRKRKFIPLLDRDNLFNNSIGKLFRKGEL